MNKHFYKLFTIILLLIICIIFIIKKSSNIKNNNSNFNNNITSQYIVNICPVGDVKFNKIPESTMTIDANWNDMLYVLGLERNIKSTRYRNCLYNGFYKQLGFSNIYENDSIFFIHDRLACLDKEFFYKMNVNVHHIDPLRMILKKGWSQDDIDEISQNIGPFFANRYSRENNYFHDNYQFYTIEELMIKMGDVYKQPEKAIKINNFIKKFELYIQSKLLNNKKIPKVALVFYGKNMFTPYGIGNGFGQRQYKILGIKDIFKEHNIIRYGDSGFKSLQLDLETLLMINPDIIIVPFAIYSLEDKIKGNNFSIFNLKKLKFNSIGKRINAIKNDRIYPGGTPLQGPIFYIFQLEMAAKQIYPEIFGKFNENNLYSKQEQLFSREELFKILN